MSAPGGREGDICVYAVSCALFLAIVAGGAFLVLYITLPESEVTAWFPVAGLVLVGFPWLFWIATFLYRFVSLSLGKPAPCGAADRAPARAATVSPAAGAGVGAAAGANEDGAVDSPGGGRRVRFGAATVMGGSPDVSGAGGGGGGSGCSSEKANGKAKEEADGRCHAPDGSSVSIEEGSSLTSHESESPLFASN